MIDPLHSLAFAVQANPGVYAVLIGSGVSRSAGIPTGWGITLDLTRKLARIQGEGDDCDPDPADWYQRKFESEPDYSVLLDNLAKTSAERQQLLRSYWEPTEKEQAAGNKRPTAAHRAIAKMVARGFVRIVISTNFDRLMEDALKDEGIVPTVLNTVDQIKGARPLIHTQCCVFKVHGDYLDTRIRNTPTELAAYPPEFDELLDRIFDEFGLIVCGWSAEWDTALRQALERAQSRRFTTFWATRRDPNDKAQKLINHRKAEVLRINDANMFFRELWRHVELIDGHSKPHPLSVASAVDNLKNLMLDPQQRIQLADFIEAEVARVVERTSTEAYGVDGPTSVNTEDLTARVRGYEAACSTLPAMATIGGYWAEPEHHADWQRALKRLCPRCGVGLAFWRDLQKYPATLLYYTLGLSAVESGRYNLLGQLAVTPVRVDNSGRDLSAAILLPPVAMIQYNGQLMQNLEGMKQHRAPLNDWIHNALRETLRALIPDDDHYTFIFDKLEILVALACGHRYGPGIDGNYWAPAGAFGYRHENRKKIITTIRESLEQDRDSSPFVASKIFGKSVEECKGGLSDLESFAGRLQWF